MRYVPSLVEPGLKQAGVATQWRVAIHFLHGRPIRLPARDPDNWYRGFLYDSRAGVDQVCWQDPGVGYGNR